MAAIHANFSYRKNNSFSLVEWLVGHAGEKYSLSATPQKLACWREVLGR